MRTTATTFRAIAATVLLAGGLGGAPSPAGAQTLSEAQAHTIAIDAYVYFYPLVSMDVTRRQLTNVEPGKGFGGPMNAFANVPTFPTADFKAVVRPNFDTLYSSGWLDVTKEPMIVSVPDVGDRYYLLPMLDMWSDVFASPGTRTTGNGAGHFLIAPPGWRTDPLERLVAEFGLPKDIHRIDAPTPHVWIIGRTKTDGPNDYPTVHKIQAEYRITPLSGWGKAPQPVEAKIDPAMDMKTPPKTIVDTMPAAAYFAYAAELMKLHPPHLTDQPIIAQMRRIGIERGKSFDFANLPAPVRAGIAAAPAAALKLMEWKLPTIARVANHWSMNTDTMGVYGNYYLKRAIVANVGLGANLPEDAIYPLGLGDQAGRPLDGASKYTMTFAKDQIPPVDAFWSVTLYDPEGFQVGNVLNRFSVASWMPFVHEPDGSLVLHFQNESPGKDREANWLPAPKGPFNLTMRLYSPRTDALTGRWNPPAVVRTGD